MFLLNSISRETISAANDLQRLIVQDLEKNGYSRGELVQQFADSLGVEISILDESRHSASSVPEILSRIQELLDSEFGRGKRE